MISKIRYTKHQDPIWQPFTH